MSNSKSNTSIENAPTFSNERTIGVNISLSLKTLDKLDRIAMEEQTSRSGVVRKALTLFFETRIQK